MSLRANAERKHRVTTRKQAQGNSDESTGKVPRELREKLKKAKAAKGLLRDLEEQVRVFVESWEQKTAEKKKEEEPELDSEDEEIVFVGRRGQMSDMPPSPKLQPDSMDNDIERDRLVFESMANDQGASFGYVVQLQRCLRSVLRCVLTIADAGLFIQSHRTTASAPGPSLLAIQRAAKHMLGYRRIKTVAGLYLPVSENVLSGGWFDSTSSSRG